MDATWGSHMWDEIEWGGAFQISARVFLHEKTTNLGLAQAHTVNLGLVQERTLVL